MESTRRRVKVYQLDIGGKWEDKGTGHVTCSYVEQKGSLCLIVTSEEDNTVLLESKIQNDDIYQRQQDTLVVWSDPESLQDLALSFQEADGCAEIWEQISSVQQKQPADPSHESDVGSQVDSDTEVPMESAEEAQRLPPANIANVTHILEAVLSADTLIKRERFVKAVIDEDYIRKLLELFNICEDLSEEPVLHVMFNIFKHLVLMNDTNLMEVLFSDDYMIPILGALEYDPEIPPRLRTKHREFLTNSVIFKQVVPFNSVELVERIHQTFRMQYLKDVVLNRILDDGTFATLNSLIFFNNLDIVTQLQSDTKFLIELFQKLKSAETPSRQRKDLLLFVQELCNLAKNLQVAPRTSFYKSLTDQGLFDVFTTSLKDEADITIRMASTDIMLLSMAHEPSLLRGFVARQTPGHPLLRLLVEKFTGDPELGVKSQCAEILKLLLEEGLAEEPTIKDEFLTVFYQYFIPMLMVPLKRKYLSEPSVAGDLSSGFVQNSICEMFSYCIRHHGYRIKYFLLGNNVAKKVLKLLSHKDTYLVLSAIRFLRAFVGAKDDFYNRHIIKEDLFKTVVEVFVKNGPRYNLLNSAVLELFDFVRKENISMLIQYFGDNFGDMMRHVDYVDVFKKLIIRYEQLKEGPARAESSISNGPRKSLKQMEDEEDDAYFRESDDEEENTDSKKGANHVAPLVDYADDDEVVTTPKTEDDEEKEEAESKENSSLGQKDKEREKDKDKETGDMEKMGSREEENGKTYEKRKETLSRLCEDDDDGGDGDTERQGPSPKKSRKTTNSDLNTDKTITTLSHNNTEHTLPSYETTTKSPPISSSS